MDYDLSNMGKASFQAIIRAVSYALGLMALSGCIMEPVNLTGFVEDDEVVEIIDRGAGKTHKTPDSDDGLIEGNGTISGLNPNKYYMVEDYGENPYGKTKPDSTMFVAANGTCTTFAGIGRVTGQTITGLTNGHFYRVRSAQVLTGNVSYYDLAGLVGDSPEKQIAPIIEGAITIKPPENGGYIFFKPPLVAPIGYYEIAKSPVTPAGPTAPVSLIPISGSSDIYIFTEAPDETETDYIFHDTNEGIDVVLYALKVIITNEEPPVPPEPEELTIKVTLSDTSDKSPVLSGPDAEVKYSQDSKVPITISINNSAQFSGISWYLDGTQISSETGTSLLIDLNNEAVQYRLVGVYTITVIAIKDGIPYSAAIEVTVLP